MEFTDGPYRAVLDDAEILTEAGIPIRPGVGSAYEKVERAGGRLGRRLGPTMDFLHNALHTSRPSCLNRRRHSFVTHADVRGKVVAPQWSRQRIPLSGADLSGLAADEVGAEFAMQQVHQDCSPRGPFGWPLRRDLDAVVAGLTLDYNSGAVEGTVNRIKQLKAAMYGRAKPDLLRKLILLG